MTTKYVSEVAGSRIIYVKFRTGNFSAKVSQLVYGVRRGRYPATLLKYFNQKGFYLLKLRGARDISN